MNSILIFLYLYEFLFFLYLYESFFLYLYESYLKLFGTLFGKSERNPEIFHLCCDVSLSKLNLEG